MFPMDEVVPLVMAGAATTIMVEVTSTSIITQVLLLSSVSCVMVLALLLVTAIVSLSLCHHLIRANLPLLFSASKFHHHRLSPLSGFLLMVGDTLILVLRLT